MTAWPIKHDVERLASWRVANAKTWSMKGSWLRPGVLVPVMLAILAASWLAVAEMKSSTVQAALFSRWSRAMTFRVEDGASTSIRFPVHGPYDDRLGYTRIPNYVERLTKRGYKVDRQARASPNLTIFQQMGGFPPYHEKTSAGLDLYDRDNDVYFAARHPSPGYRAFASVPPVVAAALLFVENRKLLDPGSPKRNPAIEWKRLGRALFDNATGSIMGGAGPGGSTLATQLEKLRHSPGGRTADAGEKLRQMISASVRAYRTGPDTRAAREQIVVDVLNSIPLAGIEGHGEVIGLRDGLTLWFGADFDRVNEALRAVGTGQPGGIAQPALAFKQVLSLLIAQRRPTYYLRQGRHDLEALTDSYLRVMAKSGVIDRQLSEAAVRARLRLVAQPPGKPRMTPAAAKAVNATRFELLRLLGIPALYALDRLDLAAETTLDARIQTRVTEMLRSLGDPESIEAMDLTGARLLSRGDPTKVAYSFTLFERTPIGNQIRIQTDSLDGPLDLNIGTKMELGSTAKVRTLITYLEIIADLYAACRQLGPEALANIEATGDPLRRWVAGYLIENGDTGLAGIMEAAMAKSYSASPYERFFTAGGMHRFANFNRRHGGHMPVAKALQQSVNLVFIRMMRDIVDYHIARLLEQKGDIIADTRHPRRMTYLRRFADLEGRQYLRTFYGDYRNLPPQAIIERVAVRAKFLRPRLAAAFRTVLPDVSYEEFSGLVNRWATRKPPDEEAMRKLYDTYAPTRLSLADRSYVASIHPLELWLAGFLHRHPRATWDEIVTASTDVRQESYGWLFKSRRVAAQNRRIKTLLEQEAFVPIHEQWQKLGYPFDSLVPSYATAIGTSGDRPDALAELMGIIVNDGVRLPTVRVQRLHFAEATPYETIVEAVPTAGVRVLRPEIAAVVRRALVDTVESGTAKRASGVFEAPDGSAMVVGGKTGTGDNRTRRFGRGRRLIESVARTRTATFMFFIGDRWYGTITAHVGGPEAEKYRFTSALPTQLFRSLAPVLKPLVEQGAVLSGALPANTMAPADRPPTKTASHPAGFSSLETALPKIDVAPMPVPRVTDLRSASSP